MIKRPLIISGPSGIGKTTLIKSLESYQFKQPLMTVTRSPRVGEIPGVDLEFLDLQSYETEAAQGKFFMDNRFLGNAYGIRKESVETVFSQGQIPILGLYMPVIDQFLREYPQSETVFMLPKDVEFLAKRLLKRQQTEEEYLYRLRTGIEELELYNSAYKGYYRREYVVENDDNSKFIQEIRGFFDFHRGPEGNYKPNKEIK